MEVAMPLKQLLTKLKEDIKEGVIISEGDIDEILNHRYDKINAPGEYLRIRTTVFHDSNQKLNIAYRKKTKVVSSSYELLQQVCFDRDYIEWNFSVPKFLYGNNVAQFVPHPGEHTFHNTTQTWESMKRTYYSRFIYFIKQFFKKNFILDQVNFKLDFSDLELNRIDFCWNCFFRTENEAKIYLDYIKKLKPKGLRQNADVRGGLHGTTYMLVSDGHSRKVYHKGTEFKAKDRKELIKQGVSMERIESLQRMADKCLRFEVTLRKQHLSYMYQTKLWRKNSKGWHDLKERAKEGRAIKDMRNKKNEEYNKAITGQYFNFKEAENIRLTPESILEFKDKIKSYELYESIINYRRDFVFGNSKEVDEYNERWFPVEQVNNGREIRLLKKVNITEDIFLHWLTFFETFVKETQVTHVPSFDVISRKIQEKNKSIDMIRSVDKVLAQGKKKTRQSRILKHLALLQKYTHQELQDLNILPRTTYYNLKKDLQKHGIDIKLGITAQEERLPVLPDYIFDIYETDPTGISDRRIVSHAQGFHIYYLYSLVENSFCNKVYV